MLTKLIGKEWAEAVIPHLDKNYFDWLGVELQSQYTTYKVYPPQGDMFNAFHYTPYDKVNVSILGQDPYIKFSQAYGISFGIRDSSLSIPPSLRNISREVESDVYDGLDLEFDYTLKEWCDQGCFMYNTALTVIEGKTGSHLKIWAPFTEAVLKALNEKDFCIHLLLGNIAQGYAQFITNKNHYIVTAPHPAAESYAGGTAGFFGSKVFTKINKILIDNGKENIKW